MKVAVTGGTGFTGRRVAARLVENGHEVRCLVRPGSDATVLPDGAEVVRGSLEEPAALAELLRASDALMNVASLGFGHAPGVLAALSAAGVERAVFFSTTALFTTLPAPTRAVRLAAEEAIRSSGLRWTILRPTMIYGAPGDRNIERLLRAAARWPALPVVGGGRGLVQPVLVDDLASAAVAALETAAAERRAYELPGREPLAFRDLVAEAFRAVGRRGRRISVPAALAVGTARLYEALVPSPRLRAEQVLRLLEDKDFDRQRAGRDLGFDPVGVADGLRIEARRLGLGGAA